MASRQSRRISALMLPWLAHGHVSPFLELAKRLSNRNFHIYICSTPVTLDPIRNSVSEKYADKIQLVELRLPSSPELPPRYHTTNGLPPHLMPALKAAYESAAPDFAKILDGIRPDLVIYDFNQPWASVTASEQNIPAIQFLPISARFAACFTEEPDGESSFQRVLLKEIERSKLQRSLATVVHGIKDKDRALEATMRSRDIILIKTFREIEGEILDYLSNSFKKRFIPVGPLVQDSAGENVDKEMTEWLNGQEKGSSVFVSFGSEYFLSQDEIRELAYGLELSGVNFIWVLRFPGGKETKPENELPEAFLDRVGNRGIIATNWASQTKILAHPSTGGFVSHCGWSSVMESFSFGIPIVAMPIHIDQPANARLLGRVGAGVEVPSDEMGRFKREDIADVISKVVKKKSGENVRKKAKELSEAIRVKGEEEIDTVVEELVQLCGNKYYN